LAMDEPSNRIRVLLAEDSEDDALLLIEALRAAGYDPDYRTINNRSDLAAALEEGGWDVVISDYSMPSFGAPEALRVVQESGLDLPFIIVSGRIGEDVAAEAMKAGAHDFVSKRNLARLPAAVGREIREAEVRRRRRLAEEALRESEERLRLIAETATDAIFVTDEENNILFANPAAESIFGYTVDELLAGKITMLIPEQERDLYESAFKEYLRTGVKHASWRNVERSGLHKSGRLVPVEASYSDFVKGGKHFFVGIIRDISERKAAEARERELEEHKREFYRRTLLAATEGKLVVTEPEHIASLAGPPVKVWPVTTLEEIGTTRRELAVLAEGYGLSNDQVNTFISCAVEALANAYKHAGGGSASLHRTPTGLVFVVTDSGPGIDALALPDVALVKGYSTAASLGMGYTLMLAFADRVYLATAPGGTTVAVEMGLESPGDAG
jgi:PAS domain S-box-containing protein